MVNLKQIIEDLSGISYNHPQINSFGFGDITQITMDIESKQEPKYPRCYVMPQQSSFERSGTIYQLSVTVMDKIIQDYSNQSEVMSDTFLILQDIFTILWQSYTQSSGGFTIDYEPQFGSQVTPFLERFETIVGGWTMIINIVQLHDYDRCVLPELPFTPPTPGVKKKWSDLASLWNIENKTYSTI